MKEWYLSLSPEMQLYAFEIILDLVSFAIMLFMLFIFILALKLVMYFLYE